ncbi:MAG: SBBP repeat-containing protein [Bacteroidales bacterium]|nr:SBBP repeat-containing protein [Bacteroidales bacterium]
MKTTNLFSFMFLSIIILNANAQMNYRQNKNLNEIKKAKKTAKINKTKIPWIKNIGQQHKDVAYYTKTFAGTVFITKQGEIVYNISVDSTSSYALRETFIRNKTLKILETFKISAENSSQIRVNYFKGNDKSKWQNNIQTYKTLNLGEIWKGIEVKLNVYGSNIEKLFYVKPGSHPEQIKLKLQGAEKLKISKTGKLIIKTPKGNVEFTKPIAYQLINGKKQNVEISYIKKGKTYGFKTSIFNPDKTLIIDPLIASTFFGGSDSEFSKSIALDNLGNVYITGETYSIDYPTSGSPYDNSHNGERDIFVSKLSSDLSMLLASTFIGGSNSEYGSSVTINGSDNIFITGETSSSDYPISDLPYDNSHNGERDVFVSKLDSDLSTLLASTFIGGSHSDIGLSIAINDSGNIYITGETWSGDYPVTGSPYDSSYNEFRDVFISKLDPDLSGLPYIYKHPQDKTICVANNTSFIITETGADSCQWQVNTGSGFNNITDSGVYTGAYTDTLNITGATFLMNNYQYRCFVINVNGSKISETAILTVLSTPATFTITGQMTVVENQIEIYTVPNNTNVIYTWDIVNGTITDQISNDSTEVQWGSEGVGYIYVVATNQCGYSSDTATLEIIIGPDGIKKILKNNNIIIYPNPAKNIVNVNYESYFIMEIFDITGKKLLFSEKPETDVSILEAGTYMIFIKDKDGILLKLDKLVIE